jgi:rare lipoprotein A
MHGGEHEIEPRVGQQRDEQRAVAERGPSADVRGLALGLLLVALLWCPPSRAAGTDAVEDASVNAPAGVAAIKPSPRKHQQPVKTPHVRRTHHPKGHVAAHGSRHRSIEAAHDRAGAPRQVGTASWYGATRDGRRTASGERLDNSEMTAAHLTLPMHSRARVTNLENGKSVTVRVTDRGPHLKGRIIDVSQSAAEQLDMKRKGVVRVEVVPLPADAPLPRSAEPATIASAPIRSRSAAVAATLGQGLAY